jgi:hypothetical protein
LSPQAHVNKVVPPARCITGALLPVPDDPAPDDPASGGPVPDGPAPDDPAPTCTALR